MSRVVVADAGLAGVCAACRIMGQLAWRES